MHQRGDSPSADGAPASALGPESTAARLESWKEIAAYLKIGQTFTYQITIQGDTYSQLDGRWNEVWKRV